MRPYCHSVYSVDPDTATFLSQNATVLIPRGPKCLRKVQILVCVQSGERTLPPVSWSDRPDPRTMLHGQGQEPWSLSGPLRARRGQSLTRRRSVTAPFAFTEPLPLHGQKGCGIGTH